MSLNQNRCCTSGPALYRARIPVALHQSNRLRAPCCKYKVQHRVPYPNIQTHSLLAHPFPCSRCGALPWVACRRCSSRSSDGQLLHLLLLNGGRQPQTSTRQIDLCADFRAQIQTRTSTDTHTYMDDNFYYTCTCRGCLPLSLPGVPGLRTLALQPSSRQTVRFKASQLLSLSDSRPQLAQQIALSSFIQCAKAPNVLMSRGSRTTDNRGLCSLSFPAYVRTLVDWPKATVCGRIPLNIPYPLILTSCNYKTRRDAAPH